MKILARLGSRIATFQPSPMRKNREHIVWVYKRTRIVSYQASMDVEAGNFRR